MALPREALSKDGHTWTPDAGLHSGIPSIGVIQPVTSIAADATTYDVIVVGAGYSGLTAARDCAVSGLKTLLVEARDRIGGRSWSSNIDGYPYEMGGTWVHWHQPNVWRELVRYDLKRELESSHDRSFGLNHASYKGDDYAAIKSYEEVAAIWTSALDKFYTIDGKSARELMPNPHDELSNPEVLKYDSMSVADRLHDIKDSLSPLESTAAKVLVLMCSCAKPETSSLMEAIKWYALCHWNFEGMMDYLMTYKFRGGQSSFAIRFFDEAAKSGNLSYVFNSPVASIQQASDVALTTRSGVIYRAKRMVSTIPLNVLPSVHFDPPLSSGKQQASKLGNVNRAAKVHIETAQTELRSWMGLNYPHNKLVFAFGDGTTPSGNTHVVSFGFTHDHLQPEEDVEGTTLEAIENVGVPRQGIKKLVFHNWHKDEFAQGAWFYAPPGLISKHLDDMRAREGNVWFANADWSVGWRSFIDGAIEEGTRCAWEVRQSLQ